MRVKRGNRRLKRRKKILAQTKGFRLTNNRLVRRAKEALLHAGQYSFNHRRKRGAQFRKLWIQRINAGLFDHDITYSVFINKLKKAGITLNRKVLSELAFNRPKIFNQIVEKVK